MTTGCVAEIRARLLRLRPLAPALAVLAAGIALLAGSAAHRAGVEARFDRLRAEHRRWSQAVSAAREERGREASIRRSLAELAARAADEGNLRGVFDPIVSPGKGIGVETKSVSYQVRGAWKDIELYEIRFSAAGRYADIARFLSALEAGRPAFVVDNVFLRRGEKGDVSADVAVRVVVR